jgi:hypothetical protein
LFQLSAIKLFSHQADGIIGKGNDLFSALPRISSHRQQEPKYHDAGDADQCQSALRLGWDNRSRYAMRSAIAADRDIDLMIRYCGGAPQRANSNGSV